MESKIFVKQIKTLHRQYLLRFLISQKQISTELFMANCLSTSESAYKMRIWKEPIHSLINMARILCFQMIKAEKTTSYKQRWPVRKERLWLTRKVLETLKGREASNFLRETIRKLCNRLQNNELYSFFLNRWWFSCSVNSKKQPAVEGALDSVPIYSRKYRILAKDILTIAVLRLEPCEV